MKIIDVTVLVVGVSIASSWVIFSGKDGFQSGGGMIVARSISVASTIDGSVVNAQPAVGERVGLNDLLIKIENGRIDRSRWVDLESQVNYLRSEIDTAESEHKTLSRLLGKFKRQAAIYSKWMIDDLGYKKTIKQSELGAATEKTKLNADEVKRTRLLMKESVLSQANLDTVLIKAEITRNEAEASAAEVNRIDLLLNSARDSGDFFDGGETSYWSKMIDDLDLRLLDNEKQTSSLRAQLIRAQAQVDVENERISTSFVEEHRAPVDGKINAVFVKKGTRVVAGTPLLQVLDCDNPIAIVPIPEHRFGEFSIGQEVTVYPADSDDTIGGKIQYISSGPLLGKDTTLAVQQDVTLGGNKAIISLNAEDRTRINSGSCDSARLAAVVIHTKSLFDELSKLVLQYIPGLRDNPADVRVGLAPAPGHSSE